MAFGAVILGVLFLFDCIELVEDRPARGWIGGAVVVGLLWTAVLVLASSGR